MAVEPGYEWVEEGFRQLRLGLAWERYAHLAGGTAERPAGWVREHVAGEFLAPEWLPGVRAIIDDARTRWQPGKTWAFPGDLIGRLRKMFLHLLEGLEGKSKAQQTLAEARDEVRKLLFACLATETRGTPPGLVRLPAIYVSKRDRVCFWLRQAGALEAWARVADGLNGEDQSAAGRVRALAEECARLRGTVAGRRKVLAPLRYLPGQSDRNVKVFDQVADLLERCSEELTQVVRAAPQTLADGTARECKDLQALIRRELDAAPADWPPRLLADLQATLCSRSGPGRFNTLLADLQAAAAREQTWESSRWLTLPAGPPTLRARLTLAVLLVERLDEAEAAGALPGEAWAEAGRCLDGLLGGAGLRAELVRGRTDDPELADQREVAAGSPERVTATGLVARGADTVVVHRKACVEVPRRLEPVVAALHNLGGALARVDGVFAEPCAELLKRLEAHAGVAAWLQALDEDGWALVWRVLQRLAAVPALWPELQGLAVEALQEFERLGLVLVEVSKEQDDSARGPWFLLGDKRVVQAVPLPAKVRERGIGLKLPDDTVLTPTVWLRVPDSWKTERPLVRCLIESEPFVAGLKVRVPEWPSWNRFGELVAEVCHGERGEPARTTQDVRAAKALFSLLHASALPDEGGVALTFRELARRVYRCLTKDLAVKTVPALNPDTLRALPLGGAPSDGTLIRWEAHDRPLGEVLMIWHLGSEGDPARLKVSCGRALPPELMRWLALPPLSFPSLPSDPATLPGHPLPAWQRELQALPWSPSRAADVLRAHRAAFQRWVAGPAGAAWFDQFVRDLVGEAPTPTVKAGRQWFAALLETGWCQCLPGVDLKTGAVAWPADAARLARDVQWEFSDTVLRGQPLGGAVRYVPTAELVQGAFSLGPRRSAARPLALAYDLRDALAQAPDLKGALAAVVEPLVEQTRVHELAGTAFADPAALVLPLLDALLGAARDTPGAVLAAPPAGTDVPANTSDAVVRLDAIFGLVRDWGREVAGLDVLPPGWSFAAPAPWAHPAEGESVNGPTVFADGTAPGAVGLQRLGLRDRARIHRPAETFISAGPAPLHYAVLRSLLDAVQQSEARAVREALDAWPLAALEENLAFSVVQFFADFWKALGESFRDAHPAEFEQLEQRLNELLERQFELTVFYPKKFQDYPEGWLTLQIDGTIKTGRVRRVLRPGLKGADNSLRVKAIVEVE